MTDQNKAKLGAMGQPPQMQPPQIKADMVKNARTLSCSCGGMIFQNGIVIKKISAILSPNGQEMDIPIQVLYCKDCGLIHPDTDPEGVLPSELKSSKLNLKTN